MEDSLPNDHTTIRHLLGLSEYASDIDVIIKIKTILQELERFHKLAISAEEKLDKIEKQL